MGRHWRFVAEDLVLAFDPGRRAARDAAVGFLPMTTSEHYTARILKVMEHVQRHLDDALTPTDLARVAHFSPFHFQRIFRGMVGETVMGHVRRLRLERAAAGLPNESWVRPFYEGV